MSCAAKTTPASPSRAASARFTGLIPWNSFSKIKLLRYGHAPQRFWQCESRLMLNQNSNKI
jgi:hypothetical protein